MGSFRPDPNLLKKHPNAITVPQLQQKERFLGALLGLAAGEAQGAQALGVEAGPGGELLLVVLRSAIARRRIELPDIGQAFVRWFAGAPKRLPDLLRASLENLRAGEGHEQAGALAWEDAGRDAPDNASLLWAAVPVALLHSKDTEGLADDAAALCRLTHCDPRSVAGCAAVATAISLLVRGDKEAEEALPRAAFAAAAFSDDVRAAIERGAFKKPADVHEVVRGSALATVELGFSALGSGASFEEGVTAVVSRGGDADLDGAIAGALLGAKYGKNSVPEKWLKSARGASELQSLAEQLQKL